jgi:hypothetical protein
MTTPQPDVRTPAPDTTQALKRRGLLAAAVACVAALVAKLSEQPVSAGVDGDVVLGASNTTAGTTKITCTGANSVALYAEDTTGPYGWGIEAVGTGYAVVGFQNAGDPGTAAVYGSGRSNGYGVSGYNPSGVGVRGESNSTNGVLGLSMSGVPILGQVSPGSNTNTIAIYGLNNSTYKGPGPGAGGFAIYGLCANGHALVGATAAAGAAAVVGATNGVAGAYAAAFYGPVIVGGAFTVVGGPKSAAVPHPDGSHRRLYCMESPESWFEDFGSGVLECGRADVAIDPDFAAMVDLSNYHVFLTEHDTHQHLIVRNRTAAGFAVEADSEMAALKGKQDVDLNGAFSWRVVAKRKDITCERLAPVTIPPEPTLPPVPDVPMTTPPTPRARR